MRKLIFLPISIIFFLQLGIALADNSIVLVKGFVQDDATGGPVGTSVTFTDPTGKRTTCKSNSKDGSYQQVLTSGMNYTITLKDFIINSSDAYIDIKPESKYIELDKNLKGKKIAVGMLLSTFNAFEPNDTLLLESSYKMFREINDFLKENNTVNVEFKVSSEDSYFKQKKVKVQIESKSKRKKYKYVKVSTEEQLTELVGKRIEAIRKFIEENKFNARKISFSSEIKVVKPVKKKKSRKKKNKEPEAPPVNNITVSINKIMNL